MLLAFYKPFGVLSQFTAEVAGQNTLAAFSFPAGVYPVGRLDSDSEGLLLLTDEKALIAPLLEPRFGHEREYWVQVDGAMTDEALQQLRYGIQLKDFRCRKAQARRLPAEPMLPARHPPVRFRKSIPTTWISLVLTEGKNRQVRRMTAAVGFPTLRLVRVRIGQFRGLENLQPGHWREVSPFERSLLFPESFHKKA